MSILNKLKEKRTKLESLKEVQLLTVTMPDQKVVIECNGVVIPNNELIRMDGKNAIVSGLFASTVCFMDAIRQNRI